MDGPEAGPARGVEAHAPSPMSVAASGPVASLTSGPASVAGGQFAANLMHFARLLRAAGLAVGSDRTQVALAALQVAGLDSRQDFKAVLAACLLDRVAHRELFDAAFALFWREPAAPDQPPALPAWPQNADNPAALQAVPQRLSDALLAAAPPPAEASRQSRQPAQPDDTATPPAGPQAALSWAHQEALRQADFDSMTADEWREAQALLAQMNRLFQRLPSRRLARASRPGMADWRASLAQMARQGGEWGPLRWRAPRVQPAPLVVLADISGSMSRYSRMLLHFAHALGRADGRVESFVFGTRLTRTTRLLAGRDPDIAVTQVVRAVADWSGGTRIATSLQAFNQHWARRVLNGGATVLLISDGLEAGDTEALSQAMERLHKSCRRLIWLNPLLRFARFQALAGGIRAMLPHVDHFLPAHNLSSLADLVAVLAAPQGRSAGHTLQLPPR